MITNIGRLRAHTRQEPEMDGSARSERRLMRGPELGLGAAIRVRWVGRRACLRSEHWRRRQNRWWSKEFCQFDERMLAFCGGMTLRN